MLLVKMEKKEEKINIEIEEEKEDYGIKESVYRLNTMDSGTASIVTEPIQGKLLAMIISTNKPVKIRITTELGIEVFNVVDFKEMFPKYIPIKVTSMNSEGNILNFSSDYYCLNGSLTIDVAGAAQSSVDVILRWA